VCAANAASVAGMVLTTQAIVVEKPESGSAGSAPSPYTSQVPLSMSEGAVTVIRKGKAHRM